MKRIIIHIVVFIFALFAGFTVIQSLKYRAMETDFVACAVEPESGNCYIGGNVFGQSLIYKVNAGGRVTDVFEEKFGGAGKKLTDGEIVDVCYRDDVFYLARARDSAGGYNYKLCQLNEKLKRVNTLLSSEFDSSHTVSGLNIVDNTAYVVMLTPDHKEAYVYAVKLDAEEKIWTLISRQNVGEGRYFIGAVYTGTVLQAGLDNGTYVYYQADVEYPLDDDKNLLKEKQDDLDSHPINTSSLQFLLKVADQIVLRNIAAAVICAVLVSLFYFMFTSRYYALKQFAVIVSSLFMLIICSILFCMYLNGRNVTNAYLQNIRICFDFFDTQYSYDNAYFLDSSDYYNSEDYNRAYDDLAQFAEKTKFVEELMLVHLDGYNEQVMVSLNSYRDTAQKEFITVQVEQMLQEAKGNSAIVYRTEDIRGERHGVFAVPLRDNSLTKKYIVALVSMDDADRQNAKGRAFLLLMGGAAVVVSAAAAGIIIRYMTKDIRDFSRAMLENTEEAMLARKPSVNNNEVEFMWNSLAEVTKRYEKVNYTKYLVLQAYYRFAPRKIEKILGKDSIIDVNIGDMVRIDGTMAMVSMGKKRNFEDGNYMESVYRDLETIGKFQVEEDGVIISMDSSVTYLKMLFLEEPERAYRFGVNVIQAFSQMEEERDVFMLLHSARFLYGVSGNSEQTFPFTVSEETEAIDKYREQFRQVNAGLVITETVRRGHEAGEGCRYIGYVSLRELHRNIKLYQVLDAFPVSKRNRYLACNGQFQDALSSFYKNDFYIARNAFTDVLKSNPTDEIARWYLFTCENFLNSSDNEEYEYGLFAR